VPFRVDTLEDPGGCSGRDQAQFARRSRHLPTQPLDVAALFPRSTLLTG
jgi:hypothetical protein